MTRPASPAATRRQYQRRQTIVEVVRSVDPELPAAAVDEAVERVAAAPASLARLAAYLADHPEALTSGHSRPPKVVGALIAALVEAGSTALVVPRCAGCDRQVELFHTRGPEERICVACWKRQHVAKCIDCGRIRPIAHRTPSGGSRCAMCRKRATLEECGDCGRLKQVAGRRRDGAARCSRCLRRNPAIWEECSRCGRTRPVNARADAGGALCPSCYTQPPDTCAGCGEQAAIVSRRDDKAVCARCYRHPRRECGGCGRVRRVALLARDGQPDLCPTCHQAPVLVCGVCGAEDRCRTTTADKSPICFRCQLSRRLDEILTGSDGSTPAPLMALRAAILAVDNPRSALGWLGRSPAITLLHAMATGERPLNHATLDAAAGPRRGRAFAVEHLRQLLIASGALPERDRHLARVAAVIDELIDTTHPKDRQVLRTYATWRLLRGLRRKAEQGRPTQAASHRIRELTAEAARFLAWLRSRDIPLAACGQADLDIWLTRGPRARGHLVGFLRWAREQGLVDDLEAPRPRSSDPLSFIAADDRWQLARRALTDDTLATCDRVAVLLLLLYGQSSARITRLTRANLQAEQDEVRLRLGEEYIVLPPPLDDLIQQLPGESPVGMAGHLAAGDPWLFPGRRPLPRSPVGREQPDGRTGRQYALGRRHAVR